MPAADKCFSNYVRNYLLCCIFPDKTYNPAVFEENHVRYLVCFGAFHVIKVLPKLVLFKTLLLFTAIVYALITSDDDLLRMFPGGLFGFLIAATANIILLIGARFRRYKESFDFAFFVLQHC
ncbi:hypothetical protein OESDEN_11274 [Oesophagostomum dentatum]|uniref:Uncharacterized protein n=1 Tax=Oesophagostomum dentatum TaxID=61180 RepID=A0A0B1SZH8_OESDE|nr:hypothetical protein OESDEN_11274 [Oesophagostomum dentatum]